MNRRLEQFLKAENISQSQFADNIGVARGSVSHILAGRNKPGFDFLLNMAKAYPSLNLDWLITGKGRMYGGGKTPSTLFDEEDGWQQTRPQGLPIAEAVSITTQQRQPEEEKVPQEGGPSKAIASVDITQCSENKRDISKIVVFFEDNTYQEFRKL